MALTGLCVPRLHPWQVLATAQRLGAPEHCPVRLESTGGWGNLLGGRQSNEMLPPPHNTYCRCAAQQLGKAASWGSSARLG